MKKIAVIGLVTFLLVASAVGLAFFVNPQTRTGIRASLGLRVWDEDQLNEISDIVWGTLLSDVPKNTAYWIENNSTNIDGMLTWSSDITTDFSLTIEYESSPGEWTILTSLESNSGDWHHIRETVTWIGGGSGAFEYVVYFQVDEIL